MKSAILTALLVLPALAQQPSSKGVNFYSLEREIRTGQQIGADLERTLPIVRVPKLDAYIAKIAGPLTSHADPQFPYRFVMYEDRGFPAAPPIALLMPKDPFLGQPLEPVSVCGGPIFVPISLLATARSESEFAFQLAHAIGHVALRHATREATREELVEVAAVPIANRPINNVMQHGIELGLLSFIRFYERQADSFATVILAGAGYDPEEAIRAFEEQAAAGIGATGKAFSVHPAPERRIDTIRAKLAELPPRTYTVTSGEFAEMKKLAADLR
jgi:predicted Zn-dependent protease